MLKYISLITPILFFSCNEAPPTDVEDDIEIQVTDYGRSEPAEEIILEETGSIYDHADSLLLKQVEDSIWNCKKTKELNQYIKDATNGERHLSMLTTEVGDEFFIRLAEDNGSNYVTHHSFYISPLENWSIKYYKALDGIRIDFQEWANQE